MSMKHVRGLSLFAAAFALTAVGCTQSTTSKDVAKAEQKVQKEQTDLEQARREAMKPTIDEDAAQNIRKEEGDVAAAQDNLNQKEREHAATQARDAFLADAQKTLDATDRQIDDLKKRASNEEGAVKDATQKQIDDLKARRERLSDAMSKVKKADLMKWSDFQPEVQTAMQALNTQPSTRR